MNMKPHPLLIAAAVLASIPTLILADHHESLSENDRAKAFIQLKFA